mmetsp:Transcript_12409/g.53365  ORF Transcript_12409/g.53365 Transcript_12409/m.53365 type:complete len:218 (-) Transcript_12409:4343-4996(-)
MEHLQGRGGGLCPVCLNLGGVEAPVILVTGLLILVVRGSLGALLGLGGAGLGGLLALDLSLVALGVDAGEVILRFLDGGVSLKLRIVLKVIRLRFGVLDLLRRRSPPGGVPGPGREGLDGSLLGSRLGRLDRGGLGLGLAESRGGGRRLLARGRSLLDRLGSLSLDRLGSVLRRSLVLGLDSREALGAHQRGDRDQLGTLEALGCDVHDLLILGDVA